MKHFYSDFLFCKNNFFSNPDEIVNFANSLDFSFTDKSFPGSRTENLSTVDNYRAREFANFFAKKLVNEIYTNIISMNIDIRFHKYPIFASEQNNPLNEGWVHQDYEVLAGVLYLNDINNFESGTSLYDAVGEIKSPDKIREDFNIDYKSVDSSKYLSSLSEHNSQFKESIKVGNQFNRLITYDSKIYHKPNDYYVGSENRLTLLFVISDYECKPRQFE